MKKNKLINIIEQQVNAKVISLQHFQKVRYEGGRLYYETQKIKYELADYDAKTQLLYLELLSKKNFIIYDYWPLEIPDITPQFRDWLESMITRLKIHIASEARQNKVLNFFKAKWTIAHTLSLLSLIIAPLITLYIYHATHKQDVKFELNYTMLPQPGRLPKDAVAIRVINIGSEDIVIKNLQVINSYNGHKLYGEIQNKFLGNTLKAKNMIEWNQIFKTAANHSINVQLTTSDDNVYTSNPFDLK